MTGRPSLSQVSLLVFFLIHTKIPGQNRFTREQRSLRFEEAVTLAAARDYIYLHHGRRKFFENGSISSPSFAEIVASQKSANRESEISAKRVFEDLSR